MNEWMNEWMCLFSLVKYYYKWEILWLIDNAYLQHTNQFLLNEMHVMNDLKGLDIINNAQFYTYAWFMVFSHKSNIEQITLLKRGLIGSRAGFELGTFRSQSARSAIWAIELQFCKAPFRW